MNGLMIRERVRIYCIAQCASPPILRFLLLVGNVQPNPSFLSAVNMHIMCNITIDHLSSLNQLKHKFPQESGMFDMIKTEAASPAASKEEEDEEDEVKIFMV